MFHPPSRRTALAWLAAGPWLGAHAAARVAWPTAAVRIVVPFPAGGAIDAFVRVLAPPLSEALQQPIVVENRTGAGGLIGALGVAQSKPDGHTLLHVHAGLFTPEGAPPRSDLLASLRPVARLTASPYVLVVAAASRHRSAQELIAAVQAEPGRLSYGSGGMGSPGQRAVELLAARSGRFDAFHVPFRGAGEAAMSVADGQVDFQFGLLGAVVPLLQSGRLRALAVTTKARLPTMPQLPTLAECGVVGYAFEPWGGLAAPARTPDVVIARLDELLPGLLAMPAVAAVLARSGALASYAPAAELAVQIAAEVRSASARPH